MLISISTSRLLLLPPTVYVLGLVIKRIWVRGKRWRWRGRGEELELKVKLPLPPGPPLAGNWFVGSLSVFRTEYVWQTFAEWSKSLGNVIYFEVFGRPFVVLNALEDAKALLEKQSIIYSDRPRMVYIPEMLKLRSVTFLSYGELWKLHRRLLTQQLNPRAIDIYQPWQVQSTVDLLKELLEAKDDFWTCSKKFAASSVLLATYEHQVTQKDDPLVEANEYTEQLLVKPGAPGTTAVDLFPPLKWIPSFLPGGSLRRLADEGREALRTMLDAPYNKVKEMRAAGIAGPSLLSNMLDEYERKGTNDEIVFESIRDVCGSMYRAGVTTTSNTLRVFVLAMLLFPDVAKKAQNELDSVLGGDRLPRFDDRKSLSYVDCILKECLRWRPPLPLGLAHAAKQDGELNGMLIPGGSLIMPNIWNIMHDEHHYENPNDFNPDRFLRDESSGTILDPGNAVFGFGRRICPGRHFALASLWIAASSILSVFDILPALDEDGREILPRGEFTSGMANLAVKFDCRFVPRNEKLRQLVEILHS
ncbi:cytochrome P450 [Pyrrhoderma noxium]|uniref:Cytochrome P450 n=1 Tax=Pyrrhoderma noxium TaxID=2282107 RepID=A0A286UIB7_9AGAM|nr:cytochrome P450 [Pyrrhoderma noxium]